MSDDRGWIRALLDEAENERMHLVTFIAIARPNLFERLLVLLVQGAFFNAFFLLYLLTPGTMPAGMPTWPRRASPSTTVTCRRTRACATWSWRSATMRPTTVT
jgi:hypothetical protein